MNILSFLNRYLLQKNIYFSHYNKNNFSSLSFKYNILTICIRKIECVIILIIIFQIRIQLTSKIFHSTHVFQLIITIVMISLILITILFLFKKKLTIIYLLLIYVILIIFYIIIIKPKKIRIKILK